MTKLDKFILYFTLIISYPTICGHRLEASAASGTLYDEYCKTDVRNAVADCIRECVGDEKYSEL